MKNQVQFKMKYFILLIFFINFSCAYPDIDSVPDFQNLKVTKEESIDLCKMTKTDKNELSKCIDAVNNN